jgi:Ribonuclease R winged-helix domain.
MSNYLDKLEFSESKSKKRLEKAYAFMGKAVINRIIAYALYLHGANRDDIADLLSMPKGTLLCLLTRLSQNGIASLSDGRIKNNPPIIRTESTNLEYEVECNGNISIKSGLIKSILKLATADVLCKKIVLLTFLENKLISYDMVARSLGISVRHVSNLLKKLRIKGASSLLDQRIGQQQDYVYTPGIKSELILQFAVNASGNGKISSHALASDIQKRAHVDLSERSIRHHLSKLGLNMISRKMKELICSQKKT